MTTKKNYIAYIRVSNKEHENSIPAQVEKIEDYAKYKSLNVVKVYTEEQSAFGKKERKVFNEMIKHLGQKEVDGVIFHKVDRSARNMKDFSILEGFFDTKDIRVIEGEFDTKTPHGKFLFRMFCNMAVLYSENLSDEVTLKTGQMLKSGYYPSKPPFGYRKGIKNQDPDFKKKYPNENARYVREIFELYDSGTYSYKDLSNYIKEKGAYKGRAGKGFIERILTNPFYMGIVRWRSKKSGESLYEGNHAPIISKELFERVQARREGRTRVYGKANLKKSYAKLFHCGCGKRLYQESPTGKGGRRGYEYLRCQNKECDFTAIPYDKMDDLLVQELSKFEMKEELFSVYQESLAEISNVIHSENEDNRKRMNTRLAGIEAEMQKIRQGFLSEVFTAEEAKEMRQSLELERVELTKRLNEQCETLDYAYFETAKEFLETFKTIAVKYKTALPEVKREILELFFSKMILKDGSLYLKGNPVLSYVSNVSNLQFGWG